MSVNRVKRVAAIHDLSGFGRCALTVIIPMLSAMGVQVCPAPTAVMSAHTAFPNIVTRDLTDFLKECLDNWNDMGLTFDCIYSGYMYSPAQIEIVAEFMNEHPEAIKVVDPVMGDDGELYRGMSADMPDRMRYLCSIADVITPNVTEYAALANEPYSGEIRSEAEIKRMLDKMLELGAKAVVITSVPADGRRLNAAATAQSWDAIKYHVLKQHYPGTGDLFAAALTGSLLRGADIIAAAEFATRCASRAITLTSAEGSPIIEGVQIEKLTAIM